ncbi:hypothetical protein LJ656_00545 [Paraburkholderia sp. MMS20-SJTR3]|uniref:Uncharacterized protein n=1 Tax=Paraburkholderia sejongensis TaxID=2886946 RepID=A0ABS8JMK8_9BURK|nr:hypothetical protein [Paraburkholderia sp. MMS20-SJTR3]MCC8391062.1 hypothetical protein [Paraburkholderia sp. MMS20-SJTR3]
MLTITDDLAATFGAIGSAVSLLAAIPYGLAIVRRTVRPHLFTWLIWALVTTIAAAGQFVAGAGPSAWCTAAIALTCILIFIASIHRGERSRTRSDWFFLGAALSAIPLWLATDDPALSIYLVTLIELAGLAPTIRKTFSDPWGESLAYFVLCVVKYALALLALRHWSLAVAFYPGVNVVASIGICVLMVVQRYRLRSSGAIQ